jgi:ABC-type uncharacterized transport system YnjBCD permease subunit
MCSALSIWSSVEANHRNRLYNCVPCYFVWLAPSWLTVSNVLFYAVFSNPIVLHFYMIYPFPYNLTFASNYPSQGILASPHVVTLIYPPYIIRFSECSMLGEWACVVISHCFIFIDFCTLLLQTCTLKGVKYFFNILKSLGLSRVRRYFATKFVLTIYGIYFDVVC